MDVLKHCVRWDSKGKVAFKLTIRLKIRSINDLKKLAQTL